MIKKYDTSNLEATIVNREDGITTISFITKNGDGTIRINKALPPDKGITGEYNIAGSTIPLLWNGIDKSIVGAVIVYAGGSIQENVEPNIITI